MNIKLFVPICFFMLLSSSALRSMDQNDQLHENQKRQAFSQEHQAFLDYHHNRYLPSHEEHLQKHQKFLQNHFHQQQNRLQNVNHDEHNAHENDGNGTTQPTHTREGAFYTIVGGCIILLAIVRKYGKKLLSSRSARA